ncbi:MAG: diguanylate cyclase [Spirochaetia bacterium]|jgi:diguanylate cyclase (GGDEF)-like protein|nr:diguanylate cyclase [Spirochaetia bacterium]
MKRRYIIAITLLFFSGLVFLSEYYVRLIVKENRTVIRSFTAEKANIVRVKLESIINTNLNLTFGLIANISVNPDFKKSEMDRLSEFVLQESNSIINISLAPGNVITYVSPYEENKKALGLSYLENEEQKNSVIRMMELRRKVLAGPVNLIQGGTGFIGRIPIYLDKDKTEYWGLASIVIDANCVYERSGMLDNGSGIQIALSGRDGSGEYGDVFFGKEEVFNDDPVILPVQLGEDSWILGAVPAGGWSDPAAAGKIITARIGGIIIALFLTGAFLSLLLSNRTMQYYALYDQLTGLANRRLFKIVSEQLLHLSYRKNKILALLFLDLDDFKNVNDNHGHKAGDRVLIETSNRIKDSLRKSDIVCRHGGDEFIVILHDVDSSDNIEKIAEKIINNISQPISIQNNIINIGVSIGISLYPEDGTTISDLLKKADSAMYTAKQSGKMSFRFYRE